jgi:hypothetical protein
MNTYLLVVQSSQHPYFDIVSPIIQGIPHRQLTSECTILCIEDVAIIPRLKKALLPSLQNSDSFYLFQLSYSPAEWRCPKDDLEWIRKAMIQSHEDDISV